MRSCRTIWVVAALATLPGTALAHHPTGGVAPETLWQGLASGLAHPVIGLDHLAFVLAAGVLAAALPGPAGVAALLGFLAYGAAGSLLHLAGIGLGPVEAVVAGSALAAGAALLLGRGAATAGGRVALLIAGFAVAGLFHGHAFAEAAVGAQPGPVGAYLAGLALAQGALGFGAMVLMRRLRRPGAPGLVRAVGAAAAVVGGVSLAMALIA